MLSFAIGVAGDLSLASPPGPIASVAIPPDAIRAHPLPPLPRTEAVEAAPVRRVHAWAPRQKPRAQAAKAEIKREPDTAPKADQGK